MRKWASTSYEDSKVLRKQKAVIYLTSSIARTPPSAEGGA